MVNSVLHNPLQLEKSIVYQEGSIVSREIFKNDNGTVTLFAFGKDQALSPHKTPYDALAQVLDGEVTITIGDKVNQLKKGDIIHMPAGMTHALKAVSQFKMLLIMIKVA